LGGERASGACLRGIAELKRGLSEVKEIEGRTMYTRWRMGQPAASGAAWMEQKSKVGSVSISSLVAPVKVADNALEWLQM